MENVDPIWRSFANAVHVGEQSDALVQLIEDAIGRVHPPYQFDIGNYHEDWLSDDSEWVTYAYHLSYAVKGRRRGSTRTSRIGWWDVALALWRKEDIQTGDSVWARRAKLYVAWAPGIRFWSLETLLVDGAGHSPQATCKDGLWLERSTEHGPPEQRRWLYCLPLEALDSPPAVEREIVHPTMRLLDMQTAASAFEKTTAVLGREQTT